MKFKTPHVALIALAFAVVLIAAWGYWRIGSVVRPIKHTRSFPVMGTIATVTEYDSDEVYQAVRSAFDEVIKAANIFDPSSELGRINLTAYTTENECSALLWRLFGEARKGYVFSEGSFDISARPLMTLWGFSKRRASLPTEEERTAALEKVGLNKVFFNESRKTVRFSVPGMGLDAGGVAKGFAVDLACEKVQDRVGLIDLGGNMRALKTPRGKEDYRVGVRHPRHLDRVAAGCALRSGEAIATSGGYERFVEISGRRYAHIMDPATGLPADSVLSVTVIAPNATLADMLSTTLFLKGEAFAKKLAAERKDFSALMILPDDEAPGGMRAATIGPERFSMTKGWNQ